MSVDPAVLQGSFLSPPGRRLWVEQAGTGPTVVFVHSGVTDRRMWDGQATALAERYHVVRYDHPGYGRPAAAIEPYTPEDDLDATLLALGHTTTHDITPDDVLIPRVPTVCRGPR